MSKLIEGLLETIERMNKTSTAAVDPQHLKVEVAD